MRRGKASYLCWKPHEDINQLLSQIDNNGYWYDHRIYEYLKTIVTFDHIKVTDISKGLFQLLLLDIIGEDFAIFWHAGYGHQEVICSKRDRYQLSNRIIDVESKSAVEKTYDFPTDEVNSESITYKLLTFNAWSGLSEKTFSVRKESLIKFRF